MAKLTITKLHCERKQDVTGKDEPEIFVAGQSVWSGKMGKGETRFPDKKHCFHNSVLTFYLVASLPAGTQT